MRYGNYKSRFLLFFLIGLWLLLLTSSSALAQESGNRELIVSGDSMVEAGNVANAKSMALEEALRQAVEQGLGVFIDNKSFVKNFQLIEDSILSRSEGYVKRYSIISEAQTGNRYRVTIKAIVSLDSIKNDLIAIAILKQEMHYPRLMILVGSETGKVGMAARSARIQLEKVFAEKHFDLVDPETIKKLHNDTKLLLEVTKDTVIAAKLGLDHNAEIVLIGVITPTILGKNNFGLESARSIMRLRVIDPTTAKVFASTEETVSGAAFTSEEAISNSGQRAADLAAKYASEEILRWWKEIKQTGRAFKITLKNVINYHDALTFEEAIKNIPNVASLDERVFGGGFLECDILYRGGKSRLQKLILQALQSKPGFERLNVQSSRGKNIIFTR